MDRLPNIQQIQEKLQEYDFEDSDQETIGTIPDDVIDCVNKKKQNFLQNYTSPPRLSQKSMYRESSSSKRSNKRTSRASKYQQSESFSSLSNSSEKSNSSMKDLCHKDTDQWNRICQRNKMANKINEIFEEVLTYLTQVKINLLELSQTQFDVYIAQQVKSEMTSSSLKSSIKNTKDQMEQSISRRQSKKIKQFSNLFHTEIDKYIKTLKIREIQISSVLFLFQHEEDEDFIDQYNQIYGNLDKFIIKCESMEQRDKITINVSVIEQSEETEIKLFEELKEVIHAVSNNIDKKGYKENLKIMTKQVSKMRIINSKLSTITTIFPTVCTFDKNDLFSQPKNGPRWKKLLGSQIKYKLYGDSQKIRQSFSFLKTGMNMLNGIMSIIHQSKPHWQERKDWGKLMDSTLKIIQIAFNKNVAAHEAQSSFSEPNGALTKEIWNLPDQKIISLFLQGILPSIQFSQEFWVPRIFQEYLELEGKIDIPDVTIQDTDKYFSELQKADPQNKIKIRINSPYSLSRKQSENLKLSSNSNKQGIISSIKSYFKKQQKMPEKLIFHVHGGGFISMSSFIHQTYTRLWANNLDTPIISVDYGKAPENPYPDGLYDCFEIYMWILYCFRQIYEVEPVQIIFVGDSAGGNMVAALTNMLIQYNLRKPDGLVLVYPALNLDANRYTPSAINALTDVILPHTLLKLCAKSYLAKTKNSPLQDYYISPIITPDKLLKQYPPTRLFVGSRDPFHDDCCRLTERMNLVQNGKATLMVFDEFPHGFLQFDIKGNPHEQCRRAIKQVQNGLRQLLN